MLKVSKDEDKWSRCYSCYADEDLLRITIGLDDSNACGQSQLTLCPQCLSTLHEKTKRFLPDECNS